MVLIMLMIIAFYLTAIINIKADNMAKTQSKSMVIFHTWASFIALMILISLSVAYVLEHKI